MTTTPDQLFTYEVGSVDSDKVIEAKEVIADLLGEGSMSSDEYKTEIKAFRFSAATIKRAEKDLKVHKAPDGVGGKWIVSLPDVSQQDLGSEHPNETGNTEES